MKQFKLSSPQIFILQYPGFFNPVGIVPVAVGDLGTLSQGLVFSSWLA